MSVVEDEGRVDALDFNLACWQEANAQAARSTVPTHLCPSAADSSRPVQVRDGPGQNATVLAVFGRSTYVANSGQEAPWDSGLADWSAIADGPLYRNSRVRMADVTDGLSQTVFLGEHHPIVSDKTWVGVVPGAEVCANNPQRFPFTDCEEAAALVLSHSGPAEGELFIIHTPNSPTAHADQMYANHPNGCNVLWGDGSVRFVSQFINADTWAALCSKNKGDIVGSY